MTAVFHFPEFALAVLAIEKSGNPTPPAPVVAPPTPEVPVVKVIGLAEEAPWNST